jgi:hypothetical protein
MFAPPAHDPVAVFAYPLRPRAKDARSPSIPFVGQNLLSSCQSTPLSNKLPSPVTFLHLCISKRNNPNPEKQKHPDPLKSQKSKLEKPTSNPTEKRILIQPKNQSIPILRKPIES